MRCKSFWFTDATGAGHFGIGVGSLVLTVNTIAARRVHLQLPLAPAPDRRRPGRDLGSPLRRCCYSCVAV